ncbi:MAG TPA: GH1 family beta-glucosidase [Thermoanaerobaculia bacterium]|jgi:beta-glucosidase|nr:GH1 family beta-glucosidase [Thermoanaerobaculia bacterium]
MARDIRFPKSFLWGASTSAFQVEGSPLADGAGQSIWYRFTHTPGLVANGDTGDVASDHYRCWEEDIRLMRDLGLNAYRFGIAWHRILPEGIGRVNAKGLDFYRALVDGLLENNIQPLITLFHWDLPAALEDRGGWLNPDIASWFAEYAQVCYRALDDRVDLWTTLNEPWVVTDGGYLHGALAPGHRNLFETPIASHNLLRAHASAVEAYRAEGQHQIGIVVNIEPKYPASDKPEDLEATARADAYMNRQYLDPIFFGTYPAEMKEIFGEAWPDFPAEDMEHIRRPLDFLGINYYTRSVTCHDPNAKPVQAGRVKQRQATHTETDWEVYPVGLADTLLGIRQRYGNVPLYITENGAAFYDPPTAEGEVNDPLRVDYFREHLKVARHVIQEGVDLRGYFAWSLLDNFEWSLGYSKRFGIIHVDYATQRRTLKASAKFYAEVIKTRGNALGSLD